MPRCRRSDHRGWPQTRRLVRARRSFAPLSCAWHALVCLAAVVVFGVFGPLPAQPLESPAPVQRSPVPATQDEATPQSNQPRGGGPQAFDPSAPRGSLTPVRLRLALRDVAKCRAALARGAASFSAIPDRSPAPRCHVRDAVEIDGLGTATLRPVDLPCRMALRLYMWEHHHLQPAAREILGSAVAEIRHFGAFSCRQVETGGDAPERLSAHATAEALDISGFRFADGREITVLDDWGRDSPAGRFLAAARDALCRRFDQVLGPEYNAVHADHFHAAVNRWSTCQ